MTQLLKDKDLEGRILFNNERETFYEIVFIYPLTPEFKPDREISVIDLATSEQHGACFLQNIGDAYILVSPDYPQSEIDKYLKAAKEHSAAFEIMLVITQDLCIPENMHTYTFQSGEK